MVLGFCFSGQLRSSCGVGGLQESPGSRGESSRSLEGLGGFVSIELQHPTPKLILAEGDSPEDSSHSENRFVTAF